MPAASPRRVIACVIRDGDRYLVCQRPAHKRHGGLWEFPGGKTEAGEIDEAAARRELREELDVELARAAPAVAELGDDGAPFVIAFVPVQICGEPRCLEHSQLAWATPRELLALPLAPSDRIFVESLVQLSSATALADPSPAPGE